MRKRQKMSRGKSRRVFTRTAKKTHKRNISSRAMRGGIRL